MADSRALGFLGYLLAGVTGVVVLIAAVVVHAHVNGKAISATQGLAKTALHGAPCHEASVYGCPLRGRN